MPQDLTDDKSTLVQVMAWCRQATSHYLNQCWPRSMSPYAVTMPQWVKKVVMVERGYEIQVGDGFQRDWLYCYKSPLRSRTNMDHCLGRPSLWLRNIMGWVWKSWPRSWVLWGNIGCVRYIILASHLCNSALHMAQAIKLIAHPKITLILWFSWRLLSKVVFCLS